jgi:hypothetical protein
MNARDKLVEGIALEAIGDHLKQNGFMRSRRGPELQLPPGALDWRRKFDHGIQVVLVTGSWRTGEANGEIGVYLGVYFPALARRLGYDAPRDIPPYELCHLHTRVNPLTSNAWPVRLVGGAEPDPDAGKFFGAIFSWLERRGDARGPAMNEKTRVKLRKEFERYGLPWLERMTDPRQARQKMVETGDLRGAVAISVELGDLTEAREIFRRYLERKPHAQPELLEWGRQNGVEP